MMRRRRLSSVRALWLAWPSIGRAQAPRPKRLAWLSAGKGLEGVQYQPTFDTVVGALRDKGWVLGQNYLIEFRFVQGDATRYPALADELIAWQPDVLYALETGAKVLVTKTRSIPIVLATSSTSSASRPPTR
jgi:putative ABC transport system substrate-binding protein